MQPSEKMPPETARRRLDAVMDEFKSEVAALAQTDDFKRALADTPADITGNRTYMQIALDDTMAAYETAVASVIRKMPGVDRSALSVAPYRQLMETRLDCVIPEEDVVLLRSKAIEKKLNDAADEPYSPSFLSLLVGRVDEPQIYDGVFESFHGGILMTIADSVACFAILTRTDPEEILTTTDMQIRFLAPCLSDVRACARVIKLGRTLCPVHVDLLEANGKQVALAQVTYMRLPELPAR